MVVAVALAAIEWRRADGLATTERTRHEVASGAGAFGVALLTYDYADLPGARTRVLALGTANFAKSYQPPNGSGVGGAIVDLKAKESAKVAYELVTDVVGDHAGAFVIVDTTLTSTAGTRTSAAYLQLSMVRHGGVWKVDAVRSLSPA